MFKALLYSVVNVNACAPKLRKLLTLARCLFLFRRSLKKITEKKKDRKKEEKSQKDRQTDRGLAARKILPSSAQVTA